MSHDQSRPSLDVIVPALNEEARIPRTLEALAAELDRLDVQGAIRVVDNGSTDRTAELVDRVRERVPEVPISVQGCSHRGKGSAVSRGMLTSSADWVGFCDADLATPPAAVAEALGYLLDGWHVVIGSRAAGGGRRRSPLRGLGSYGFRLVVSRLVSDIKDTQCGFKFFQGDVARRLFRAVQLDGFAFDVELLALAHDLGLSVKEMPVDWSDCPGSTFRPIGDGLAAARDVARLHLTRRRPIVVSP